MSKLFGGGSKSAGVTELFLGPGSSKILGIGEKQKTPKPPDIPPPTVIPTPDTEEIKKKQKLALIKRKKLQGRESTFLSDDKMGA